MKSTVLLLALFGLVLSSTLLVLVAEAGTIKDSAAIVTGTVASLGLYVPYKMLGVVSRCRKDQNQNSEACHAQDGCQWNEKKSKCRAAGMLGLRKYYQDRNEECKLFMDKKSCEKSDACNWGHVWAKGCHARVLNTFRSTRREGKIEGFDKAVEQAEAAAYQQFQ